MAQLAKFSVGQLIRHKRFDYRGVIIDVDATFSGTDSCRGLRFPVSWSLLAAILLIR